ncbi:hypothetical protein [Anaeromusa acidaminophila]|uniref:hypothetical protein n=1 Tax=Anaeromusa acidaminophila TaxID=81464 RepID=UPI00037E0BE9|nr:hypothetical protein [Anaeromusa acidaminophila]
MMRLQETVAVMVLFGLITVVGNMIGYQQPFTESLIGYAILLVITVAGMILAKVVPGKLPMVFWVSLVALLSTSQLSPVAKDVTLYTGKIDFLALCTPILAYAGLGVGKDLEIFKKMSWRIIIVALAVYTGTFVFSTAIAQFMLHLEGVI